MATIRMANECVEILSSQVDSTTTINAVATRRCGVDGHNSRLFKSNLRACSESPDALIVNGYLSTQWSVERQGSNISNQLITNSIPARIISFLFDLNVSLISGLIFVILISLTSTVLLCFTFFVHGKFPFFLEDYVSDCFKSLPHCSPTTRVGVLLCHLFRLSIMPSCFSIVH